MSQGRALIASEQASGVSFEQVFPILFCFFFTFVILKDDERAEIVIYLVAYMQTIFTKEPTQAPHSRVGMSTFYQLDWASDWLSCFSQNNPENGSSVNW